MQSDEYYVRDVSGKEIATYSGSSLTQWNIWGLDNVGKINADTTRNYYLKDHLGSIRVVLNSTNTVISAQDYDAWGYQLENRSYNSSAMKYDFTGKERDNETSYDYFGARYYDSRIGRWGGVEPLLNNFIDVSPYVYSINQPLNFLDPNGKKVRISGDSPNDIYSEVKGESNLPLKDELGENGEIGLTRTLSDKEYNKLSQDEKYFYDAIRDPDNTYKLMSLKDPYLEGQGYVLGGGDNAKDHSLHYIHYESAALLQTLNIYRIGQTAIHEIIESYLEVSKGYSYDKAHAEILKETMIPNSTGWTKDLEGVIVDGMTSIRFYVKEGKDKGWWEAYRYNISTKEYQWIGERLQNDK